MQDTKTIKIDLSAPVAAACLVSMAFSLLALFGLHSTRSEVQELDRGHRSVVQFLQSKIKQDPAK